MSISKQLNQIFDIDTNLMMQKRMVYFKHHEARSKFLKGLQESGKKGKEYSDMVVEFDKQYTGGLW